MPTLKKLCNYPGGCGNYAIDGDYCPGHKAQIEARREARKNNRERDRGRASASARGYDARWKRIRAIILAREPVCVICRLNPATEVDHIKPLAEGGTHEVKNLQPLCKSCHSKKTVRENRGKSGRINARKSP